MALEGFGLGAHRDGEPQQAAGRSPQGPGVVRMGAAGREGDAGGAGSLGDARQGSEVARILQTVEIEIGPAGMDGQGLDAGAGQPGHGQDAAGGVGVGELLQQLRAHRQRRDGERAGEPPPRRRGEERRRGQNLLQGEAGGQG